MDDIVFAERVQEVYRLAGGHRAESEAVCRMILPWHPTATNVLLAAMVVEHRDEKLFERKKESEHVER